MKGETPKHPDHTLPLAEDITEEFVAKKGKVIYRWLKVWYKRDQEEKKILRGNQETGLKNIPGIIEAVGRDLKKVIMNDYVGTQWDDMCMAKNRANKVVTLALQEKKVLEQG